MLWQVLGTNGNVPFAKNKNTSIGVSRNDKCKLTFGLKYTPIFFLVLGGLKIWTNLDDFII